MKKLTILLIIALLTSTIVAQDEGDKTLPGEGEEVEIVTTSIELGNEDLVVVRPNNHLADVEICR